jgi:hypothetical protein
MVLRSTRATARHLEIPDGGTSNVSEPESLRKTHLTRKAAATTASLLQYTVPVNLVHTWRSVGSIERRVAEVTSGQRLLSFCGQVPDLVRVLAPKDQAARGEIRAA